MRKKNHDNLKLEKLTVSRLNNLHKVVGGSDDRNGPPKMRCILTSLAWEPIK